EKGKARIRTIVTAEHTRDDLERALAAFKAVAEELNVTLHA
ncbi:MAG: 8-amino-7-oxononanoate synthase, partial [Exiguobacterium profundum]